MEKALRSTTALTPVRFAVNNWRKIAVGLGLAATTLYAVVATPLGPTDDLSRYDKFIERQDVNEIKKEEAWREGRIESILLHLTTEKTAGKILKQEDIEYTRSGRGENLTGSFAIIGDPEDSTKCRLFECFFHTFDDGDPTSTGFKMGGFIEHKLKNGSREEAQEIRNKVFWGSQKRDLTTEAGRPVARLAFGGWTQESGGDANARHIEYGGLPLQHKNLLGIDGREDALEACAIAAKLAGFSFDYDRSLPTAKVIVSSTSMGAPNAMLAVTLLREKHPALEREIKRDDAAFPDASIDWYSFVPMGLGQTARQLTEIYYNKRYNKYGEYQTIEQIGALGEEARERCREILKEMFNYGHTTTFFSTSNEFAFYYVGDRNEGGRANDIVNNIPQLPGMQMYVLDYPTFDSAVIYEHSILGNMIKGEKRHMLYHAADLLRGGSEVIYPANYNSLTDLAGVRNLDAELDTLLFNSPAKEATIGNNITALTLHAYAETYNIRRGDSGKRDPLNLTNLAVAINNVEPGPIGPATQRSGTKTEDLIRNK